MTIHKTRLDKISRRLETNMTVPGYKLELGRKSGSHDLIPERLKKAVTYPQKAPSRRLGLRESGTCVFSACVLCTH